MLSLGIFDPLDREVDDGGQLLWETWIRLAGLPFVTSDGHVFKFAEEDERNMRGALASLRIDGGTEVWRPSGVEVDYVKLSAYLEELELLRSRRGRVLNRQYLEIKGKADYTFRDIANWESEHPTPDPV
ncbi:MAG: hypothetical protein ACRBBW_20500 [Cellvibrionaceae bacterium]